MSIVKSGFTKLFPTIQQMFTATQLFFLVWFEYEPLSNRKTLEDCPLTRKAKTLATIAILSASIMYIGMCASSAAAQNSSRERRQIARQQRLIHQQQQIRQLQSKRQQLSRQEAPVVASRPLKMSIEAYSATSATAPSATPTTYFMVVFPTS